MLATRTRSAGSDWRPGCGAPERGTACPANHRRKGQGTAGYVEQGLRAASASIGSHTGPGGVSSVMRLGWRLSNGWTAAPRRRPWCCLGRHTINWGQVEYKVDADIV